MSQSKEPVDEKNAKESESNEFEFYFQFTKPLVLYLPTPEDRAVAAAWVQKLESEPDTEEEKRLRLDYLKLLLFVLQRGRLSGIFRNQPPPGPLQPFPRGFTMSDMGNLMIDQDDGQSFGGGDARLVPYTVEISNDLREFVAAQEIPNFGVQMYYAWSSDEPIHNWTSFTEEKFPQILDKIKLLKEIKSDEKTGSASQLYGKQKSCIASFAEKEKTRVKSPQEIEKTQVRSYQTYLGLVGRMGGGFKDAYDDDPEKFCKQDQRKAKFQKNIAQPKKIRNGQNAYPGQPGNPPAEDYENFLAGIPGNVPNCRCPPPYHSPECEANRTVAPFQEQMPQNINRSSSPKPGPSWCTPVQKVNRGRQGTYIAQPGRAPMPEETQRSFNRRSPSPAEKSYVANRNDRTQIIESSCKPPQPPTQISTCTGGTGVCTCPCPRSSPPDSPNRPCPPMNTSGRSDKSRSSPRPPAPPPSPQQPMRSFGTALYKDIPASFRCPEGYISQSEAQEDPCQGEEEYFSGEDPARPAWAMEQEADANSPPYFGFPSGSSSGRQTSGCDTCSPNVSPLAYQQEPERTQAVFKGNERPQQQQIESPEYFADTEEVPPGPYGTECYSSTFRSTPGVNFYRQGPSSSKGLDYFTETEGACDPTSQSGGGGGKDTFSQREPGRPLQTKMTPSSPGTFAAKNNSGRFSNMVSVLDTLKQKAEAHREKCTPGSGRRTSSRRSTFVKSPSGFFVPNISPNAGRVQGTPYPEGSHMKNSPPPQKPSNCYLQVPQTSPFHAEISPQRGYTSSNSVGLAISTPSPRRPVRNYKSGPSPQEACPGGMQRNICVEEEEYPCLPPPDGESERAAPINAMECLEVCEEEPEPQEQCDPQWFAKNARPKTHGMLQQDSLPQAATRRGRLITSTPKQASFGMYDSTIPCYTNENEICAEQESYWHPVASNNTNYQPKDNYGNYPCPNPGQFQNQTEYNYPNPNGNFNPSGSKEKNWREPQSGCEEIPQEEPLCNQTFSY